MLLVAVKGDLVITLFDITTSRTTLSRRIQLICQIDFAYLFGSNIV
jgi:hypothetical protein